MTLSARIRVRRASFAVDVELAAGPGEVLALLGPNGAGKTTCLRALAGLEPIDAGYIRLGDRVVEDPVVDVRRPAAERLVGMVFADQLLFPHLSALDNVAFGLRARRTPAARARSQALAWLERVEARELADRRPDQLSAGQAQRVALARALAGEPELLLLDEPLAAVDVLGSVALRAQLRHHLRAFGGVSVLVTHDPLDAMMLADRLVVLDHGRAVQQGPPAEVAARPRSSHVASLVGLNLLRGQARSGTVAVTATAEVVTAGRTDGDVFVCFRPSAVALHRQRPTGSPRNVWPVLVRSLAPHGDVVRLQLDAGFPLLADITPAALIELDIGEGDRLWAGLKATDIAAYPA